MARDATSRAKGVLAMSNRLASQLAAIGTTINPAVVTATRELYSPLAPPLGDVRVTRDVAYGDDPRQKLDLFRPASGDGLPIVVFAPGGGFVGGDKNVDGTFQGNIGAFFARNGVLGVVANYRLAPAHPWPAGGQDVGRVVAWLAANARAHGGDPAQIFLWGHSAGATHVASYLFDPEIRRGEGGVVGAILLSGLYRMTRELSVPGLTAYFGADEAAFAARSPITHARSSEVPLMLCVAEHDPPFLALPSLELAALACERDGRCPRLAWFEGHNHFSPAFCVGTSDDNVGPPVLSFVRSVVAAPAR
jgi:triacylglycerol lipase